MVEFGGWEMPVLYSGVKDEHLAVRSAAGLFDVSHMGEFEFKRKNAVSCVDYLTSNNVSKLSDGKAHYSLILTEDGKIVDDIIAYRISAEHIMMVVNAGNIDKDWKWVSSHLKGDVEIKNRSDDFALMALQGPRSVEILQKIIDINLGEVPSFGVAGCTIANVGNCMIARTGYTGEDGFEIFTAPDNASTIWNVLLETGSSQGLKPVGLGARDTLRLEMKYSLYGHEITLETNPIEAGLGWVVKLKKESDFIGKSAIKKIKAEGPKRKCIGFRMIDPGIPREGYEILPTNQRTNEPTYAVGVVTSGTMSPSLNKAIGTGYVPTDMAAVETKIYIDIRGQKRLAEIVETPFYKKQSTSQQVDKSASQ